MAAGADDMVEQAFDPKQQDVVASAIEKLTPDEAQYFLDRLEAAIRRRKIQLGGYLSAMVVWVVTMVLALVYYGASPEGTFVGWMFVVPFGAVGLMLLLFGKWAARAGAPPVPPAGVRDKRAKAAAPASAE